MNSPSAPRWAQSAARIIRQLLTESVMLALTGGILGLILGFLGVRALLAISPAGLPRIGEDGSAIGMDWRVLAFTLAVSCLTGILFGLFPAFSVSRTDLNSTLKERSNRAGTGIRHGRVRAVLVVSEVLLALVLLIGSALLIRTFVALHAVNPGFDSHNVVTMEMSLTGSRFEKTAGVAQLSRDGRQRLNAIPGVEELGLHLLPAHPGPVRPALHHRRQACRSLQGTAGSRLDERLAGLLQALPYSRDTRPRVH